MDDAGMLVDHDFHPDEPSVRLFRTAAAGVLRLDDGLAISEAVYEGGVVLRHYAFADQWFKMNVTTDRTGWLTETGDERCRFALNCDIATPMERDGDHTFGVDLFIDVLMRGDGSYIVTDVDDFNRMLTNGVISSAEASGAQGGLTHLLTLIEAGRLLPWLNELAPFQPCDPPAALPAIRTSVPDRLRPRHRRTW